MDEGTKCLGGALGELWWRDPEKLKHEREAHRTLEGIEMAHGPTVTTLRTWWGKLGLPKLPKGPIALQPGVQPESPSELEDAVLAAMKRLGDDCDVVEIADLIDVAPKHVKQAVDALSTKGYRIELGEDDRAVTIERVVPSTGYSFEASPRLFEGERVRFGVVSDTHLWSREHDLGALHTAYDVFEAEGITEVFHPGDLVCGKGVYRHQINDVLRHTFEEQVQGTIDEYPQRDGIVTRVIGGNHDLEGDFGKEGADPVKGVCNVREDMEYCGRYEAWFDLPNGGRIHVLHPGGGGSYAVSYRAQKIAEAYEGGMKPSLTLFGHWHRAGWFEARGIQLLLCGTFEGSTSLAKRYGLGPPALGFYVVECVMAEDGSLVDFWPRWRPFYRGRKLSRSSRKGAPKG